MSNEATKAAAANPLARADRKAFTWGLVGFLGLPILGSFWALPHVEDELDEETLAVGSYQARTIDGYTVEWNGRDGYLTVPAGTSRAEAEMVAADLADIAGTRDVEIRFDGLTPSPEPATASDGVPASFNLAWSGEGRTGTGAVPAGLAGELGELFGVETLDADADRTLSPETFATLSETVSPLIEEEIVEGTLSVENDLITLTGVVPTENDRARLTQMLGDEPTIDSLLLTVAAADEPANFVVEWANGESVQRGTAPSGLGDAITALNVDQADLADGISVEAGAEAGLMALAPLLDGQLTSGSAQVVDGALSIRGIAGSQADLDAAASALAGIDGAIDLQLDPNVALQTELDELLLLGIEFESGTAIPTPETEGLIDRISATLGANPEISVEIVGHTDDRGPDELNQELSESRAEAVLSGLVARGIDADRLTASGEGESQPVDTNDTAEGQQNNRRVEITIKEIN